MESAQAKLSPYELRHNLHRGFKAAIASGDFESRAATRIDPSRRSPGNDGGLDMITSKGAQGPSAERRFEHTAVTQSPRPFARAFSAAVSTAFGFMSTAVTFAAPARAAARARMPDPVPTSTTRLPLKSSRPI
jgi:hypothetical protein